MPVHLLSRKSRSGGGGVLVGTSLYCWEVCCRSKVVGDVDGGNGGKLIGVKKES